MDDRNHFEDDQYFQGSFRGKQCSSPAKALPSEPVAYPSPEWGKQEEPIGDVGSTMEEGEERPHTLSIVQPEQFKQLSEEEKSNSRGSVPLSGTAANQLPAVQIKHLKSSWLKASYDGTVKRIHEPPRNIDELKVVLCTRFGGLRPLLELEYSSMIRLEFRTQNAYPFMPIDSEVDLISAFYTCNEIQ